MPPPPLVVWPSKGDSLMPLSWSLALSATLTVGLLVVGTPPLITVTPLGAVPSAYNL